MPDADGYPTDDELTAIRSFNGEPRAWFDLIKAAWWAIDWGWNEVDDVTSDDDATLRTTLYLSTAGWSGNEDITKAMRQSVLWSVTWESQRRGGHYVFTFPAMPR